MQVTAGQSIVYELIDDGVVIRVHPGALASFGALKPRKKVSANYRQIRDAVREDWADHVAEEGK